MHRIRIRLALLLHYHFPPLYYAASIDSDPSRSPSSSSSLPPCFLVAASPSAVPCLWPHSPCCCRHSTGWFSQPNVRYSPSTDDQTTKPNRTNKQTRALHIDTHARARVRGWKRWMDQRDCFRISIRESDTPHTYIDTYVNIKRFDRSKMKAAIASLKWQRTTEPGYSFEFIFDVLYC